MWLLLTKLFSVKYQLKLTGILVFCIDFKNLKKMDSFVRNSKLITAFSFALLLFVLIKSSSAQEETQCRGHEIKLSQKQKSQITECLDEAGIKSFFKIPAEKLPCLGVCILEKKEMLTPDGRIDHAKALAYIDAVMTGPVKKPLIDGIDKCIKDHGDKIKMDKDPKCMTFMDVGQCVHDVFFDVCVED